MDNINGVESSTATASATNTQDSKVTELQNELNRAIEERKAANAEAAEYRLKEKARAEKEAAEQGKFAELYTAATKERDELAAAKAALESSNATALAQLAAIETARKTELLQKIPESVRNDYSAFDVQSLEKVVKLVQPAQNSQGSERGNGNGTPAPPYIPTVPFAGSQSGVIDKLTQLLQGQ
jgi:anti-sigma factor RsiW